MRPASGRYGSPTILASSPTVEYRPRPDQLLAVMNDHFACYGREITVAEARAICVKNHTTWRDRIRKWKWIQSGYGTYVQVEDV